MKKFLILIISISTILFSFTDDGSAGVLEKLEKSFMPDNYYCKYQLINKEQDGSSKEFEMKVWGKNNVGSLIEFTQPVRSKGIKILEKNGDLWMYNPRSKSKKPIRLALKDSFQGSVFSNYDVADTRYIDDYDTRFISNDGKIAVIELNAKDNTKSYSKLIIRLDITEFYPLEYQFFTKSGLMIKKLVFSDFRKSSNGVRPYTYTAISNSGDGKQSIINILEIEENNNLPDSMFSVQHLAD